MEILTSALRALFAGALVAVGVGVLVFLVCLLVAGDALEAAAVVRRVLLVFGAIALLIGAIGIVLRSEPKGSAPRPFGLEWRVALIVVGAGVEVVACLLDLALYPLM